jgi:hypothetical protein
MSRPSASQLKRSNAFVERVRALRNPAEAAGFIVSCFSDDDCCNFENYYSAKLGDSHKIAELEKHCATHGYQPADALMILLSEARTGKFMPARNRGAGGGSKDSGCVPSLRSASLGLTCHEVRHVAF